MPCLSARENIFKKGREIGLAGAHYLRNTELGPGRSLHNPFSQTASLDSRLIILILWGRSGWGRRANIPLVFDGGGVPKFVPL